MNTKEQIAEKFADIMVKKMEEMKSEKWEKPWFDITGKINFYPQNYTGRKYTSGNAFFLMLASTWNSYETPVFLTFNQCRKLGLTVTKGEKSFPVYYKNFLVYQRETNKRISFEDYNLLDDEEKKKWRLISYLKYYNVFNLDQTNFKTVRDDEYKALLKRFIVEKEGELIVSTVFECEILDKMLADNSWVCDIFLKKQNRAYYSGSDDLIVCPLKKQFPHQHNFYSTLLHEMTHSTGNQKRLNRPMGVIFGDDDYAREEVIAELTAAFTGTQMNVFVEPSKDSIAYLNGWIKVLKQSPEFIFNLLDDVVIASNYIVEQVNSDVENFEKVAS